MDNYSLISKQKMVSFMLHIHVVYFILSNINIIPMNNHDMIAGKYIF